MPNHLLTTSRPFSGPVGYLETVRRPTANEIGQPADMRLLVNLVSAGTASLAVQRGTVTFCKSPIPAHTGLVLDQP
jgi:hypothetical protein